MNDTKHSSDDLITISIAIERYLDHAIDIVQARHLIMPVFGVPADDCGTRDLVDFLDTLLDQVRPGDLSGAEVVRQIAQRAGLST